jgi:hypothetical protein
MNGQSFNLEYVFQTVSVLKEVELVPVFDWDPDPVGIRPPIGHYSVGEYQDGVLIKNGDGSYQFYWRGWEDGTS